MATTQVTFRPSASPITYGQPPLACRLHYFVRRTCNDSPMEITDVACRIPRYWGHCDHATRRPLRQGVRKRRKGSGDALQDSAATCGEFIGGDIRRCDG